MTDPDAGDLPPYDDESGDFELDADQATWTAAEPAPTPHPTDRRTP